MNYWIQNKFGRVSSFLRNGWWKLGIRKKEEANDTEKNKGKLLGDKEKRREKKISNWKNKRKEATLKEKQDTKSGRD